MSTVAFLVDSPQSTGGTGAGTRGTEAQGPPARPHPCLPRYISRHTQRLFAKILSSVNLPSACSIRKWILLSRHAHIACLCICNCPISIRRSQYAVAATGPAHHPAPPYATIHHADHVSTHHPRNSLSRRYCPLPSLLILSLLSVSP